MPNKVLNIKGAIISNDDKWIYDWLEWDAVCPKEVENFIKEMNDEDLVVEINSGGGDVFAGSEIYTAIRGYKGNVVIRCVGLAGSAASVILTAAENEITPTGMVMVHNTAGGAKGDFHAMDRASLLLQQANKTIASAYKIKTGMGEEELLAIMDKETWLTAEEAVHHGFCDRIMVSQNTNGLKDVKSPPFQNKVPSVYNTTKIIDKDIVEKIKNKVIASGDSKNNAPGYSKEHFFNTTKKEGENMETEQKITTVEQLRAVYPELVQNLENQAKEEATVLERNRLKEIDDIAGNLLDDMVIAAKYENPITADALALQALKKNSVIGAAVLDGMINGIEESGTNDVKSGANSGYSGNEEEKKAAQTEKIKNFSKKLMNRKAKES